VINEMRITIETSLSEAVSAWRLLLEKTNCKCCKSHSRLATLQDLREMEQRMKLTTEAAVALLNELSTASDSVSIKLDHLVDDVNRLITGLAGVDLTPEQEALVDRARLSVVTAVQSGVKLDASVAAADEALPHPAPAGS
jgi:hypothetical protein